MRTKVTLVLVFLNVALFFFIFKFEREWRTTAQLLEARRRVLGSEAADIRSLEVTGPGGAYRLERQGDTWWLKKPLEWPANPHAVSSLILDLQLLEHETSFSTNDLGKNNNPTLADYGFDLAKPKFTVEFTSGEGPAATKTTFWLGDTTKVEQRLYLLSSDQKTIHVVGRALLDNLSLSLAQLRADTLLTIPVVEARSLTIRAGAGGAPVRVRREGARWSFETPIIARASKTALELTLGKLDELRAVTFNPTTPPATLPSAAPALRITLEGRDRRETLFIGEALGTTAIPASATAPGPVTAPKPDTEYYAQLEGRVALFTVALPATLLETLHNAQENLREKQILDFDARAVTAIKLTDANQTELTLQRLEPPAGSAPDAPAAWQVVRRSDGAQGPQTLPAERAAVKRLLDQLSALAAKKFQSDAPAAADIENWGFNRPERSVALTLAGNVPPIELQLGTDSKGGVFARLGPAGSSVYAVDPDVLRELPVVARAWRDRQVREPLPAAAKIVALKLTDLADKKVLLDVAFDADGKPKTKIDDPKSLDDLLPQLRSLRAKNFVQDAFTERVTLAGEERPWRYQLDATVALPGGAGEQTNVSTLFLSERGGGDRQLAGAKEADAVFEIEQPFLDALWSLTYGHRDPGAPATAAEPKK